METTNWNGVSARTFPEDLRVVVDADDLVHLVLEAVQECGNVVPHGRPRAFLSVLTYAYAIGLSSSEQVEHELAHDPHLLYLSGSLTPTASQLRQFRRHHRPELEDSLMHLFHAALTRSGELAAAEDARWSGQDPARSRFLTEAVRSAARKRLESSVLADTMSLDC